MENALDFYYDYRSDKFISLEDVEYKNNRDINLLIEELRQYTNQKNGQDINGEYDTPLEWEQTDVKILLECIDYLKELAKNNSQIAKHNIDMADCYRKLSESYYLRLKNVKKELKILKHRLNYEEDYCMEDYDIDKILEMIHIKED